MEYTVEQKQKMSEAIKHFDERQISQIADIDRQIVYIQKSNCFEAVDFFQLLKLELILLWEDKRKHNEFLLGLFQRFGPQLVRQLDSPPRSNYSKKKSFESGKYIFYLIEDFITNKRIVTAILSKDQSEGCFHDKLHEKLKGASKSIHQRVAIIDSSILQSVEEMNLIGAHLANEWTADSISLPE